MNYTKMVNTASEKINNQSILSGTTYTTTAGITGNQGYLTIDGSVFQNWTIGDLADMNAATTIKKEVKTKLNMDSSNKYYRVLQDTPAWLKGALLVSSCGKYTAVGELFNQDKTPSDYYETANIVENAPSWFGRVYPVKVDGKTKYLAKEEAKKAIEAEIQY